MAPELSAGTPLPLGTRLWFAWACLIRVLFDGAFARRAFAVRDGVPAPPALPAGPSSEPPSSEPPSSAPEASEPPRASIDAPPAERPETERRRLAHTVREPRPDPIAVAAAREAGALALLALLQREGRLVDFLQQDVASFSDEDIGAAARVVHAGSRKALAEHATIAPIYTEEENATVEVPEGYEPASVKLVGDVKGTPPFTGKLRHRGWRAAKLQLPEPVAGHDARVLAPAEVEL